MIDTSASYSTPEHGSGGLDLDGLDGVLTFGQPRQPSAVALPPVAASPDPGLFPPAPRPAAPPRPSRLLPGLVVLAILVLGVAGLFAAGLAATLLFTPDAEPADPALIQVAAELAVDRSTEESRESVASLPQESAAAIEDLGPRRVSAEPEPGRPSDLPVESEPVPERPSLLSVVPFAFDSLSAPLGDLRAVVEACPGTLEIVGHTCSVGSDEVNLQVGLARAVLVQQALTDQGIAIDRLRVRSAGASEPVADNSTRQGRSENRRVTLTCLP